MTRLQAVGTALLVMSFSVSDHLTAHSAIAAPRKKKTARVRARPSETAPTPSESPEAQDPPDDPVNAAGPESASEPDLLVSAPATAAPVHAPLVSPSPSTSTAAAQAPPKAETAAPPVLAGALPGSFLIPGTDTSLKIYGHVHVDATYDIKGRVQDYNNNDWASNVFVQPLDGADDPGARKKGQFFLTARTSRFGISTSTPIGSSKLVTKLEADFNAPNSFQGELVTNSTLFRLRHAYGELGGLLVGQTWSNFIDLGSYPDTVDFNPPGDTVAIRQAMIRYALSFGPASLSIAIENSRSLTLGANSGPTVDTDRKWYQVPDATANFTVSWSWGHLSARGVALQYRVLDRDVQYAWGAALSGSLKFLGDTLVWAAQGGDGIGRYTLNDILQGAFDTGTEIRKWKSYGYHAGFTQAWSSDWRSNLIWSQTFAMKDEVILATPDAPVSLFNKRVDQAFVNTFWRFVEGCEVGVEYAYGQRRTFDGQKGTQHRINVTFHYSPF